MARCTSTDRETGKSRVSSSRLWRIAQPVARQRFERADLRGRSRHPRNSARDDAKLADVGDRAVAR
jgi:hypothetical protein